MNNPTETSDNAINILLLGETGAGKSSTLNALVNYLKFDGDFKEVLVSLKDLEEVIPTQFTLPHPTTGDEMTIQSGSSENERQVAGLSATRTPIAYTFNIGQKLFRIIDTPGIGDTAGTQEDKQNFDQILHFLQHLKNLNAIIFIVKGNESRKTVFFRYCIIQLFLLLHKSVSDNIIFCFTHSRDSLYGPGAGFKTLKSFLENDIKEVKLNLVHGKNCFFVDNESYRFLVAKRQNFPFDDDLETGFRHSWEKSAKQIQQMLSTIVSLPPHNLSQTVSLNAARKIILELAQPIIQMQTTIRKNLEEINKQIKLLQSFKSDKEKLESLLRIEIWDLRSEKLDFPTTVCTSQSCIELVMVDGEEKVFYKTRCHKKCFCIWVVENMTNQFPLMFCEAMSGDLLKMFSLNNVCNKCGCSWREHMHVSCDYTKEKKNMIDVESQIDSSKSEIDQLSQAMETKEKFTREYEGELKNIQEISAKFAQLLSSNSYFTHNKVFEDYIQFLVDEENKKEKPNVEPLKQIKVDHESRVRILTEAIGQKMQSVVRLEEIPILKQQLLSLKHSGAKFCQILENNNRAKEDQFNYQEKHVQLGELKNLTIQ